MTSEFVFVSVASMRLVVADASDSEPAASAVAKGWRGQEVCGVMSYLEAMLHPQAGCQTDSGTGSHTSPSHDLILGSFRSLLMRLAISPHRDFK